MRTQAEDFFRRKWVLTVLALFCALLWGIGFPLIKFCYEAFEIDTSNVASLLTLAGLRFFFAGLLLVGFHTARTKESPLPARAELGGILLLALVGTVLQYVFQYVGLAHTAGSIGSILGQINVFLLVFLTPLFFPSDRITMKKVIGSIIGFMGIVLVKYESGMSFDFAFLGEGFVILGSTMSAFQSLIGKRVMVGRSTVRITGFGQMIGGAVLLGIGFVGGGSPGKIHGYDWFLLAALIVTAALANAVWMTLIQYNSVTEVSIYKFGTPLFGVLFSFLFLRENVFRWKNLAALVLVCLGIVIVNGTHRKIRGGLSAEPVRAKNRPGSRKN